MKESGCRWYLGAGLTAHMDRIRMRLKAPVDGLEPIDQMETFRCHHLCMECQSLGDGESACSGCHQHDWMVLQNHAFARSLQESEEAERYNAPIGIQSVAWIMAAIVFGGNGWLFSRLLGWFRPSSVGIVIFFIGLGILFGFSLFVGQWLQGPLSHLFLPNATQQPLRWKSPGPRPLSHSTIQQEWSGPCAIAPPLLKAPWSQRACMAYRVAVFLYDPKAMQQHIWLLDESVALSCTVQEERFEGDRIIVGSSLEPLDPQQLAISEEELALFLRKRGVFWNENDLMLFETIVEPETLVQVVQFNDPVGSAFVMKHKLTK